MRSCGHSWAIRRARRLNPLWTLAVHEDRDLVAIRSDLHQLVDRIPDTELPIARRFLDEFLSQNSVDLEFAESIRRGLAQANAGETIACASYDEMVDKLLDRP